MTPQGTRPATLPQGTPPEPRKKAKELTPEEIKQLTPEQVTEQYKRLVWKIANKFSAECKRAVYCDISDLAQAGMIGLLRAHESYNPETCEVGFMTHAAQKILTEILAALNIGYRYNNGESYYIREPTLLRLDQPINAETDITMGDLIPDTGETVEEQGEKAAMAAAIRDAVQRLPEQQREIICKVYLEEQMGHDVARELGISYATLNGRKHLAFNRLRRILESKGLRPDHHVGLQEFSRTWTSETELAVLNHERLSTALTELAAGHNRESPQEATESHQEAPQRAG